MPVASSQLTDAQKTNHRAMFETSFAAAMANQGWRDLVTPVPTEDETVTYHWFGTTPTMQDVDTTGAVIYEDLSKFSFSLTNVLYKGGIRVERRALEYDRLNLIQPRINQLGMEAAAHTGRLVGNLLETPGNAYNGTAFFSDSHTIGSASIDNEVEVTSAAAVPTVIEAQSYIRQAMARMASFQDDKGRTMGLTPDTIVVPRDVAQVYWQAAGVGTVQIAGGGSAEDIGPILPPSDNNMLRVGPWRIWICDQLTDVNDVYFLYTRGPARPFIWQVKQSPQLEIVSDPNSQVAIEEDQFIYSVRKLESVGVTEPTYAVKVVDAGS